MLIVRLKEEKKCKEEPDWKWTLVYTGKKSKSFKLHYCMSSLHMLICLRETRPGGCGLLNFKLLRFMQFSFSVPSVMPQAWPSERGTGRCLQLGVSAGPAQPQPGEFTPAPSASSGWDTAKPRMWVQTLVSFFLLFSPWAWCELFQRSKDGKKCSGKQTSPVWWQAGGPKAQPAHSGVPCSQCVCH